MRTSRAIAALLCTLLHSAAFAPQAGALPGGLAALQRLGGIPGAGGAAAGAAALFGGAPAPALELTLTHAADASGGGLHSRG